MNPRSFQFITCKVVLSSSNIDLIATCFTDRSGARIVKEFPRKLIIKILKVQDPPSGKWPT